MKSTAGGDCHSGRWVRFAGFGLVVFGCIWLHGVARSGFVLRPHLMVCGGGGGECARGSPRGLATGRTGRQRGFARGFPHGWPSYEPYFTLTSVRGQEASDHCSRVSAASWRPSVALTWSASRRQRVRTSGVIRV